MVRRYSSASLWHCNERRHEQIPKAAKPLVVQEGVKGKPDRKVFLNLLLPTFVNTKVGACHGMSGKL